MVNYQRSTQKCTGIILILMVFIMSQGKCVPQPQALYNEWDEALYNEWKKYHQLQSSYNSKWPSLRDLVLTADYDNSLDSNENANERFIERLRQLDVNGIDLEKEAEVEAALQNVLRADTKNTVMPMLMKKLSSERLPDPKENVKDRAAKKNVQFPRFYMSPCHFKICNMGRKRNARFISYFY